MGNINSNTNPVIFKIDDYEYKIYDNDFLLTGDISEDERDEMIEGSCLYDSISVNTFRFMGWSEDVREIVNIMKTEPNWFRKYVWSKEKRVEYEKIVHDILMRVLEMDSDEAWHETEIWSGFGAAPGLDDWSDENFQAYLRLRSEMTGEIIEEEDWTEGEERLAPAEPSLQAENEISA